MRISAEDIAVAMARIAARERASASVPPAMPSALAFGDRFGPVLPLPDLAFHGDLPVKTDQATRDRIARTLASARAADEIDAIRETFRPDLATCLARARNRAASSLADDEFTQPLAPLPRVAPGIRPLPVYLDPAPISTANDTAQPFPVPSADEAARVAASLADVNARIDQLRADLAMRDDLQAGTRSLRGEPRRLAHNSIKLLVSIRARLMLPDTTARRLAAVEGFQVESEAPTGMSMSAEQYGEQQSRKLKLGEMAKEICRRLEEAGVNAYRDAGDMKLWRFFIHTEMLEELPQYRRLCINPAVAAQSRANILASLEFFLQEHRFCRFWTFTTGQRCFAREIPARLDEFFVRLRKLNAWMRKEFGLEIIIRTTEFGTLEMHADGNDCADADQSRIQFALDPQTLRLEPTYHPHFHLVVYSLRGYRPPDQWKHLCERVRARWGYMVDFGKKGESGVIQNAREIVKYVTKPGDILKLSIPQLREFYDATANRRLVRPMGSLQKDMARRRTAEKALVRRRVKAGASKWFEVDDHNKTLAVCQTAEERAAADDMADSNIFDHEMRRGASAAPDWRITDDVTTCYQEEVFRTAGGRAPVGGRPVLRQDAPSFCKVVAFLRPTAGPTRRKENCVLVMGNRLDLDAVRKHPLVESLCARTIDAWRAGELLSAAEQAEGRACIYVHTGTVSVPDPSPPPPPSDPPRRPARAVQLHFEHA